MHSSKKQPPPALLFPFGPGGHDSVRASYLSMASSRYSQNHEANNSTAAQPALKDCNAAPLRMVTPNRTITSCVPEIFEFDDSADDYAHDSYYDADPHHRSEYGHFDFKHDVRPPSPTLQRRASQAPYPPSHSPKHAVHIQIQERSNSPTPLLDKPPTYATYAPQPPRSKRKISLLVILLSSVSVLLLSEEIVLGALWSLVLTKQEAWQNAFLSAYFESKIPNAVGAAVAGALMLALQAVMHRQLVESRAALMLWSFVVVFVTFLGCCVAFGVAHR
ncbi:uncharacterized protein K452DRAFT_299832 [Aplosporella prunicola CBS 121167]|uniref:Uncharacterized protein n=1 Tax=Aplosporella prunicola CBS 121167 TaxID=1176127 RepID=A0A6A6B6V6_9PEZI|nr:uncharacterized protein K452DRAFT_299832 [Aplosporella prunicola CBS 121167]KAF2139849.1 hypothetical protein K452DRAFT_299832 [Aplosporella prunicola CBS 121167]